MKEINLRKEEAKKEEAKCNKRLEGRPKKHLTRKEEATRVSHSFGGTLYAFIHAYTYEFDQSREPETNT